MKCQQALPLLHRITVVLRIANQFTQSRSCNMVQLQGHATDVIGGACWQSCQCNAHDRRCTADAWGVTERLTPFNAEVCKATGGIRVPPAGEPTKLIGWLEA